MYQNLLYIINVIHIKTEFRYKKLADFYDGNIWSKAYEVLKQELSDKSLTYQDA